MKSIPPLYYFIASIVTIIITSLVIYHNTIIKNEDNKIKDISEDTVYQKDVYNPKHSSFDTFNFLQTKVDDNTAIKAKENVGKIPLTNSIFINVSGMQAMIGLNVEEVKNKYPDLQQYEDGNKSSGIISLDSCINMSFNENIITHVATSIDSPGFCFDNQNIITKDQRLLLFGKENYYNFIDIYQLMEFGYPESGFDIIKKPNGKVELIRIYKPLPLKEYVQRVNENRISRILISLPPNYDEIRDDLLKFEVED